MVNGPRATSSPRMQTYARRRREVSASPGERTAAVTELLEALTACGSSDATVRQTSALPAFVAIGNGLVPRYGKCAARLMTPSRTRRELGADSQEAMGPLGGAMRPLWRSAPRPPRRPPPG